MFRGMALSAEIYQLFLDGLNCLAVIEVRTENKRVINKLDQVSVNN